jgi:glycosyltransferase involved in cell wall biosynthesis
MWYRVAMKLGFVHEWITTYAGSEKVLAAAARLYPRCPIYVLMYDPEVTRPTSLGDHPMYSTFLQHWPGSRRYHQLYLPLMPFAVEQHDLSDLDVVVSSHHAVAKGALTRADQCHISYVHTPARYAWDLYQSHLHEANLGWGPRGVAARLGLHYLRNWDVAAANRVDHFVANSRYIARRIAKTYRRQAQVIYPPVEVDRFDAGQPRDDFYLAMSRFVPYKRVDLIVDAFTRLDKPLVMIGDGPLANRIAQTAGHNVKFISRATDHEVADYMQRCRAFVFAAEEDFGITVVEAQAAGAPVIAFGKGGATETVIEEQTGLFFKQQTAASLVEAVERFEQQADSFDAQIIADHARQFSQPRFEQEFTAMVDRSWDQFKKDGPCQT